MQRQMGCYVVGNMSLDHQTARNHMFGQANRSTDLIDLARNEFLQ